MRYINKKRNVDIYDILSFIVGYMIIIFVIIGFLGGLFLDYPISCFLTFIISVICSRIFQKRSNRE